MKIRLHWLGLAHTVTHPEWNACAFTMKVYKGCPMMTRLGNTVYHYGNEESEVECTEHVSVMSKDEWTKFYGDYDWRKEQFKHSNPEASQLFTKNAIEAIRERYQPGDFLLCTWGTGHKPIADGLSDLKDLHVVEPGIGYPDCFAPYRVFESSAKMHLVYGQWDARHKIYQDFQEAFKEILSKEKTWELILECLPQTAAAVSRLSHLNESITEYYTTPKWTDAVIPNYFNPDEFTYKKEKDDYALFMGRIINTKGVEDAMRVCDVMGWKLKVAGQGSIEEEFGWEPYKCVEEVGYANIERRRELMANARCVFVPTYYVEPFGGVHMEALMSGTPVITTDWGVFRETVPHGEVGWRCRNFEQMVWAAKHIDQIDPKKCREWAMNFSMDRIGLMYQEYFESLLRNIKADNKWHRYPGRKDLDWLKRPYKKKQIKEKTEQIITHNANLY